MFVHARKKAKGVMVTGVDSFHGFLEQSKIETSASGIPETMAWQSKR